MSKKFYGIDMQGKYYLESKDKDVETFEERRLIYDPNDEEMYFGKSGGWSIVSAIPSGAAMWFYENSPPDGWTLIGSIGDELLAVKGGSTYTTGGAVAGTWTISGITSATHNHMFKNYIADSNEEVFDVNGDALTITHDTGSDSNMIMTHITSADGEGMRSDWYTNNKTPAISQDGNWRPDARVGILCTKD